MIFMVGHPKYDYGDTVSFKIGTEVFTGTVEIIDSYGTFFDNSDVSYDVMCNVSGQATLFKHINEKWLIDNEEGDG